MGNFVVFDALKTESRMENPVKIAELIMAAPDVDRDQFVQGLAEVRRVVRGLTLYASAADKPLVASRTLAGGVPRAGDVPSDGPIILSGLDTIDVTSLGEEMFGLNHSVFAQIRSLIDDIGILIRSTQRAMPPRLPQIRPAPEGVQPSTYWRYAQ